MGWALTTLLAVAWRAAVGTAGEALVDSCSLAAASCGRLAGIAGVEVGQHEASGLLLYSQDLDSWTSLLARQIEERWSLLER
eukprot:COSAG02_NODE_1508_length_12230_cov_7.647597_3_plen_82_part_00